MISSHPLARSASVFTAKNNDGSEYRVLAIVTTLELDPKSQDYKKPFVEKLSRAARDYLADSDEAAAFEHSSGRLINAPSRNPCSKDLQGRLLGLINSFIPAL